MNATQRKYLEQRLATLVRDKVTAINSAYPIPQLTAAEMYAEIASGVATLKPFTTWTSSTNLFNSFEYSISEDIKRTITKRKELTDQLHALQQSVQDQLYLGDAQDFPNYLATIQQFTI